MESTLPSRIAWSTILLVAVSVLGVAAWLSPAAEGHGTHTQLGLPPCGVYVVTGYPCPGCGLTTSFAHMAEFSPLAAVNANPFGVALFLLTAASVPISLMALWRGIPVWDILERTAFHRISIVLAIVSMLDWLARLAALMLR